MLTKTTSLIALCLLLTIWLSAQSLAFSTQERIVNSQYILDVYIQGSSFFSGTEEFAAFGVPVFFNHSQITLNKVVYHTDFWDDTYFDSNEEVMIESAFIGGLSFDRFLWVWGVDMYPTSTSSLTFSDRELLFSVYFIENSGGYACISDQLQDGFYNHYDGSEYSVISRSFCGGVLPVELTTFEVNQLNCTHQLSWTTASEQNNSHFEIQLSENGKEFKTIGQIVGNGTTLDKQQYQYTHTPRYKGQYYYRLLQVDFDGSSDYSDIITIRNECNVETFNVYPTAPSNGQLEIQHQSTSKQFIIYDVVGKPVKHINTNGLSTSTTSVDISDLTTGLYLIQNEAGTTRRFIIPSSN